MKAGAASHPLENRWVSVSSNGAVETVAARMPIPLTTPVAEVALNDVQIAGAPLAA